MAKQIKDLQYYINTTGGEFSFDQLASITRQNFAFISQISSYTFAPLLKTNVPAGVPLSSGKVIGFSPKEEFSSPSHMAVAIAGVRFNADLTAGDTLQELRALQFHELGHNLGLKHNLSPHSIMSLHRFRTRSGKSLPWRRDLLEYHREAPLTDTPLGVVTVDDKRRIMIPSLDFNGLQYWVLMKHLYDDNFIVSEFGLAEDNVTMTPEAFLTDDGDEGELHLTGPSFLGFKYPLVKLRINQKGSYLMFTLIRGS